MDPGRFKQPKDVSGVQGNVNRTYTGAAEVALPLLYISSGG